MRAIVTTPPTELPFSIELLRSYCRVLDASDDEKLTDLAFTAFMMVQDMTSRSLLSQTLTLTLDSFPATRRVDDDFWYRPVPVGDPCYPIIEVPRPPLTSVTSIKYYDSANVQRTLSAVTDYRVDAVHSPGRIEPINPWPSTYKKVNAVEIVYVAGYAKAQVPVRLSQAVKQLTAFWYDDPQAMGTFPLGIGALIDDYVVRYAA